MSDSFITLSRKILSWRWYKNNNITKVFVHCLLKANWQDKSWENMTIKRGQFVTSYSTLSEETGLSVKQIRNSLKKLAETQEILTNTTNRFTLVTIIKYNDYQNKCELGANKGQTEGKQGANKGQRLNNNKQEEQDYYIIMGIDDLFKKYISDERLNKSFQDNFRITSNEHHRLLKEFTNEQKGKGIFTKSYTEYASHFYHWFKIKRKVSSSLKPNSNKTL